jgi:ketosteroid isomerase-like protein
MDMKKLIVILITTLLISCSGSVNMVKESQDLLNTDIAFARMSLDKGAAAAFEFYMTADAMVLPHNSQPIYGRDDIVKGFGDDSGAFTLEWTPEKAEVSASGDLGWTWGRYKQTIFKDGDDIITHGKYLNIWKKQDDGTWRLAVDMGNSNPEP